MECFLGSAGAPHKAMTTAWSHMFDMVRHLRFWAILLPLPPLLPLLLPHRLARCRLRTRSKQRVPAKFCTKSNIQYRRLEAYFILKMKYPRVYEHFDERESLIWILDKDFLHQIFVVFRAIWSKFDVSSHNLSTYLELVTSERSTPMY